MLAEDSKVETLGWEDVQTIILVNNHGVTYRISKAGLVRLIKPYIEDTLTELWKSLTEEP